MVVAMLNYIIKRDDSLKHFGIKGQKWGIRRYENEDGTLTEEGKERYRKDAEQARKEIGDASRSPYGMGTGIAESMTSRIFGGPDSKKYRELNKVIYKASNRAGSKYSETFDRKGKIADRHKAALDFVDAIASTGMQYINENFSEKDREKAKAFVYASWIQSQDKEIKLKFGQINHSEKLEV